MSKPTFAEAERLFRAGDPSARDALEPLALAQHPGAARCLGELLAPGDAPEACAWFALAAELGDPEGAARLAELAGSFGAEPRARFHAAHLRLRGRVFGEPEAPSPEGPAPNAISFMGGALARFGQRVRETVQQAVAEDSAPDASADSATGAPDPFAAFQAQAAQTAAEQGLSAPQPYGSPPPDGTPLAEDPFAAFQARAAEVAAEQGMSAPRPYGAPPADDPYARLSAGQAPAPPPPPGGAPAQPGFLRPFGAPAPQPQPAPAPEEPDPLDEWMAPGFTDPWLKPQARASGRLKLKRVTVVDPSGFDRPLDAYSILVPSAWEAQGTVRWVQDYEVASNCVQLSLHAATPDGRTGFTLFPSYTWSHSNMGFGPVGPPPLGAVGYVERMLLPKVRNHVEGLRILERTPLPDVARSIWEASVGQVQGLPGVELKVDAARLRIGYSYRGVAYEEWISATTQCVVTSMSMPGLGMFGFGFGAPQTSQTFVITAERLSGFHAPAGELDQHEGLLGTILASGRTEPQWAAAVQQFVRTVNGIKTKGSRERAEIRRKTFDEISAMRQETYEKQQALNDKNHKRFIQSIRGVESWVDPSSGKTIELSYGAKGAWRNALGEVVVTDNAFDADKEFLNWTKLRRPPE